MHSVTPFSPLARFPSPLPQPYALTMFRNRSKVHIVHARPQPESLGPDLRAEAAMWRARVSELREIPELAGAARLEWLERALQAPRIAHEELSKELKKTQREVSRLNHELNDLLER